MILKTSKMSSVILANGELAKLIKKTKLETIEKVNEPDNTECGNICYRIRSW